MSVRSESAWRGQERVGIHHPAEGGHTQSGAVQAVDEESPTVFKGSLMLPHEEVLLGDESNKSHVWIVSWSTCKCGNTEQ